jgi:hypothetical protein
VTQTPEEIREYKREHYRLNRDEKLAYQKQYLLEKKMEGWQSKEDSMISVGDEGLIGEEELLEMLGISTYNLRMLWRKGLRFVEVSRTRRLYLFSDLIECIKDNRETETDAEPEETPED